MNDSYDMRCGFKKVNTNGDGNMPIPSETDLAEYIEKHGRYRLRCVDCFREDFDGIKELPSDWEGVHEFQSLKNALSTYDDNGDPEEPPGFNVSDWETHRGTCPSCLAYPGSDTD